MFARAGQRRFFIQNQPRPRQRVGVIAHVAFQPHALKILRRLQRFGRVNKDKAQLARQLLMRLRVRPVQHAPQCRVQQAVFRTVDRKFVKLRKKAVASAQVLPQMRSYEQLAAQGKQIVLPRVVIAAQAAFYDALHRAQKFANPYFQQRHVCGTKLRRIGLDMLKLAQTAQHVEQQPPDLRRLVAARGFADFGQNFNLKPVRRANHAHKTGHLHGGAAAPLYKAQPLRTLLLRQTPRLLLQPVEYARRHGVQRVRIARAAVCIDQRIKLVDRDARHTRTRQAVGLSDL